MIVRAGPPRKDPSASRSLNSWASEHSIMLVAMPTIAIAHIQKTAPGPPSVIATATPAILPPPTRPPTDSRSASRAVIVFGSTARQHPEHADEIFELNKTTDNCEENAEHHDEENKRPPPREIADDTKERFKKFHLSYPVDYF